MAITFACECGKQMQAKDEFAGRRMKCPACQRIVTIPGHAPNTAHATAAVVAPVPPPARLPPTPPVPVVAAGPVRFSCACGKLLQADASKIGRPLRCPACGTLVTVPAESHKPALARRTAASINPWADPGMEQRITPWQGDDARRFGARDWERHDRRRERGLVAGLLVLLCVLAAGVAGWYFLDELAWAGTDTSQPAVGPAGVEWAKYSDLDLLPRDAIGLLAVRPAALWNGQTGRAIRAKVSPLNAIAAKLTVLTGLTPDKVERLTWAPGSGSWLIRTTGLTPGKVERLTLVASAPRAKAAPAGRGGLVFVKTVGPYEQDKVQMALTQQAMSAKASRGVTFKVARVPDLCVAFLNDSVFVLGRWADVAWFLDQEPSPETAGPLTQQVLPALRAMHTLVAFLMLPKGQAKAGEPNQGKQPFGPLPDNAPPFLRDLAQADVRTAFLTLDTEPELRLHGRLSCATEADAQRTAEGLRALLALARVELTLKGPAPSPDRQMSPQNAALLAGVPAGSPAVALDALPVVLGAEHGWFTPEQEPPAAAEDDLRGLAASLLKTLRTEVEGKDIVVSLDASSDVLVQAAVLATPALAELETAIPAPPLPKIGPPRLGPEGLRVPLGPPAIIRPGDADNAPEVLPPLRVRTR